MKTICAIVAAITMIAFTGTDSRAETPVERQCSTGKCTCSYIASTCRAWNAKLGVDQSPCEGYRQSCLANGEYHDRNRNIAPVIRR